MIVTAGSQEVGGRHLRNSGSVPASYYFELASAPLSPACPFLQAPTVRLELLLGARHCLSPREHPPGSRQRRFRATPPRAVARWPVLLYLCSAPCSPPGRGGDTCIFLEPVWPSGGRSIPEAGFAAASGGSGRQGVREAGRVGPSRRRRITSLGAGEGAMWRQQSPHQERGCRNRGDTCGSASHASLSSHTAAVSQSLGHPEQAAP